MKKIFFRLKTKLKETLWKYKLSGSNVRIQGKAKISRDVQIVNSTIYVDATSTLKLGKHVRLDGIGLFLTNGAKVEISDYSFIEKGRNSSVPEYIINSGNLFVADHTKLACSRLWVRFGGILEIGKYTNINNGTEIRSDEFVKIGNFCRISYNIRIWDTNTHNAYSPEVRRKMTIDYFPSFGREFECPVTKPVIIGDGCWLGERVSILKGTTLGENVTVAFNTTVSNKNIPAGKKVISKSELTII